MLYFDYRTGGHTVGVIIFRTDAFDTGYSAYSPEYFAEHSEHVCISTLTADGTASFCLDCGETLS